MTTQMDAVGENTGTGQSSGGVHIPETLTQRTGLLLSNVAVSITRVLEEALGPLGLHLRHYTVLERVAEAPASQREIGESMRIDRNTVVLIIDDLERDGLVERRRNEQDRRAYVVELTDAGRAAVQRARPAVEALEDRALEPLSPDQRRQLHALLYVLASHGHLPRFEATKPEVSRQ